MAPITLVIILLSTIFYVKNILAEIESTAVLLECGKESSKTNLKHKIPPYHTIDNCVRKIRIAINITNEGKTSPEKIFALVNHVNDVDNGAKMYLLNPLVVRLGQEQVLLAYPFHYLSAVNARVSEIIINYENRKNFTGCDDTSMINPTCGLKYEKGSPVLFSEGFCCECPPKPVNEKQPRGGQDCSLDVGGDSLDEKKRKYKASAHCLHFNDIWYSVSAVNKPFILHETFLQVYIEKLFKNASSAWFALTHDEDFALSPQNTYQYDENKTIVISYITDSPTENAVTLPLERRLLTPLPMPAVESSKVPVPIKKGATDYLLLPKDMIDSEGDVCDVAGVSYKAFALQPDRCKVPKNTCLKNQPLDFWEEDDEKRASGGKGNYLLEKFGIPFKDPIIVDPETKEHWLALEYHNQHRTVLFVEANADEITIMTIGKHAQISKITSSTVSGIIHILVSVLNADLMPAKFNIQAVDCAYGVPNSNNESVRISPQLTEDVLIVTKSGSTVLDEKFGCTVHVASESYGIVAKREVTIHPRSRCMCNFHCECACMSDSLECELMAEEDYQTAGFRGSLPVLTAKPPYKNWFFTHPLLALLTIFAVMIFIGIIKSIFGVLGCHAVGDFGMDVFLYRRKEIKNYIQPNLKHLDPVYDDEGYPIHPDTKQRVKVTSDLLLAFFNIFFLFFWPCLLLRKCCKRTPKLQKKSSKKTDGYEEIYSDENLKPSKETRKMGKPSKETPSERKMKKPSKETSSEKKIGQKNKHSTDQETRVKIPAVRGDKQHSVEPTADDVQKKQEGSHQRRRKVSELEETPSISYGPSVDVLSKGQKQWQEGKKRVDATLLPKTKGSTISAEKKDTAAPP